MAGLSWQEMLLQAYRNYLLVTQSIFLALTAGLLAAQASVQTYQEKLGFYIPGLAITIIGLATLAYLWKAEGQRRRTVDWWQKALLRHELQDSAIRHFSAFKVAMSKDFRGVEVKTPSITEVQINNLLRPKHSKPRVAFTIFEGSFAILWIILSISAVMNLSSKL